MGIPGLMKEIGKGDRTALAKLAIDHFEKHKRPLRIAIDAAIWNFQTQYGGQGGKNPALRTLYFRLLRLLALPIHPVFVYDGKNKPLTKRGKTVSRYGTCVPAELSKNLVARFQFPHHIAPGEAEAECAFLQQHGIVDAVMTQDVDAMMFGSTLTFRDWSKEGTKGNKGPTHVSVLDSAKIKERAGLDSDGMVLVAMLNGGDYHEGVAGFGPGLSCEVARAGFGTELIELVKLKDEDGIREWRERLQYELESNESGYFQKRHKTLKVPHDFPNQTIMGYYLNPAVSSEADIHKLERRWLQWWDREIDIPALREYVKMTFDWLYKKGATYFIRSMAQPLFQRQLQMNRVDCNVFTFKDVKERRTHFTTDAVPELRMAVVPEKVVGLDMTAEEEDPEFALLDEDRVEDEDDLDQEIAISVQEPTVPVSPTKRRQKLPYDPAITEKWWIPEALLLTGLPMVIKDWHQEQEAIRADPIRFATRKCKPVSKSARKMDETMKTGALDDFFNPSKIILDKQSTNTSTKDGAGVPPRQRQPLARARSNPTNKVSVQHSVLESFFKAGKFVPAIRPVNENICTNTSSKDPCEPAKSNSQTKIVVSVEEKASPTDSPAPQLVDSCLEEVGLPNLDEILKPANPKTPRRRSFKRAKTMPIMIDSTPEQEALAIDMELPDTVTRRKPRNPLRRSPGLHDTSLADSNLDSPSNCRSGTSSGNNSNKHDTETGTQDCELPCSSAGCLPAKNQAEMLRSLGRKVARSRDSLPGTWKTVVTTPSKPSRISFVDLTDL